MNNEDLKENKNKFQMEENKNKIYNSSQIEQNKKDNENKEKNLINSMKLELSRTKENLSQSQ
jgi:hypothetical protein